MKMRDTCRNCGEVVPDFPRCEAEHTDGTKSLLHIECAQPFALRVEAIQK